MPNRIANDGRIIIEVGISFPLASDSGNKRIELVADTGSHITIISYNSIVSILGDRAPSVLRRVQESNFGYMCRVRGIVMELEIEDHGGGNEEIKECRSVSCHFKIDPGETFIGVDGIIGMDQFDSIGADPVKSADGTRGYLARRK